MSSSTPKRYDAFLSYNAQDRPAVQEVADRLKREGLELYLEEWKLAPGREFQPALAEGLRDSKSCVVLLGPNGLGPWQKQEIQVAIDMRARDEAFPVIPLLLPGAERPRRGDVAHLDFLINASWVEFLTTLDDERAFRSLVWGITGINPRESDATRYEGVCPYRGLEAFRPDDAKFFFGRENLTGWLTSSLRRDVRAAQGVRFLGVLGPSGSGKSSVVLAGLVPRLLAGAIEGSEQWPVAILRPGDDPLKNLASGVASRFLAAGALPDAAQVLKLADDLRADARALDVFAQGALHDRPEDVRLVVVVDQFEEVFTYRPQEGQARARFERDRDQFFSSLLNAAAAAGGRVAVVLTMRSDFLSACAKFEQLSAVLSSHQELVGPMTSAELREAIERPAYLVGCEVEPRLAERLLADMDGQPGALPLLQFALKEAWKEREVRRLTLREYTGLGQDDKGEQRGIEGVLDRRANEIYRDLTPAEQDLCRRLFLRLVQPGERTEDTKRRVSYRELLPDDPARAEAVRKLVQTLASRDARLITTEGTDATDGAVEVAHEALIRGWTLLRKWVDAERMGLRIHRRLTEDAKEWADASPEAKEDFLYSGARLAVCREWVATHRDDLSAIEGAFLAISQEAERQRERTELENERRRREAAEALAEHEQRGRRLWMALAATVLTAVALAAIVVVPLVVEQYHERKMKQWVAWSRSAHGFSTNWHQMPNGLYQVIFNDMDIIITNNRITTARPFPNRDEAIRIVIDRAVQENLTSLISGLDLSRCGLTTVPPQINRFQKLESLILSRNDHLKDLPHEIGELTNLTTLDLGQTALSELPPEIGRLISLRKLEVPRTNLSELPAEIGGLRSLISLHLSNNRLLRRMPAQIGQLSNLTELHLDNTGLKELPPEVGELEKLARLHLSGNSDLIRLPKTMLNLRSLEMVNLSRRLMRSEPDIVLELHKRGVSVTEGAEGGGRRDGGGGGGQGGGGAGRGRDRDDGS